MTRSRLILRVEHPDGVRLYWSPHHLVGHGSTPEEAVADYDRRCRELAEDGLRVVGVHVPVAETSTPHGGASGVPTDHYYGVGRVMVERVTIYRP